MEPSDLKAKLIIELGDTVVKELPLTKKEIKLGRERDNDIVFANKRISRHHSQIKFEDEHFVLYDLKSSNGTFLNTKRIDKAILSDGDMISLGYDVARLRFTQEVHPEISEEKREMKVAVGKEEEVLAELILLPDMERVFPLTKYSLTIGRGESNNIVIQDPAISRKHAQISYYDGQFTIYDLHSSNGTMVRGKQISKEPLRDGDIIILGNSSSLEFHLLKEELKKPRSMGEEDKGATIRVTPPEESVATLPRLIITHGDDVGRVYELSLTVTCIGRAGINDIVLDNEYISRQHAAIVFDDQKFILSDLGSSNGTFVNGEQISRKERVLEDKDIIRLGKEVELVFRSGEGKETTIGEHMAGKEEVITTVPDLEDEDMN